MRAEDLSDRIALVTGAGDANGIGVATARALAARGASVFLTSTTGRCEERAAELREDDFRAEGMAADLTRADDVALLVAAVHERMGSVSVLVNNAGMTSVLDTMADPVPTHLLSLERWRHSLERNLTLTFGLTAAVLPDMIEQRFGRIVNVASTTGVTGAMVGESAYASAKAGVVGFTRALAVEYADQGVTANAVAPGWIATASQTADEQAQGIATPIGRSGTPAEVAHAIAMLCGRDAGYITGQCLVVDGGNAVAEERAAR